MHESFHTPADGEPSPEIVRVPVEPEVGHKDRITPDIGNINDFLEEQGKTDEERDHPDKPSF